MTDYSKSKKHGNSLPSVRRSLVLSFAQKYTNLLITLPTIIVLSRLLTPTQIGVYSVAVAFVNIVQMLRDFGTSEYLIQVRELDDATARSAFTITLIIAWTLGLLLLLASPWVAAFFNEEGMRLVLEILSINFFLLPFGSTVNALLMRSMQYGIRYKINTVQQIAQSCVTITLAWIGYGYLSPAWGSVAGMVTTVTGCMVWGRAYRIRGLGITHWRPVASFGIQKTLAGVMSRAGDSAPDFVIGRMLGFADAGIFSRGYGLIRMFRENVLGAIGSVAFSALSQRQRENKDPAALYLKSVTFVSGISWPFLAFASLMSYPIIRIMFGDQWDAAVPILRLLALNAFLGTAMMHNTLLLTAVGKVGVATQRTAVLQTVRVIVLVVAATHSLIAIAAALVPTSMFGFTYTCSTLVKHTQVTWRGLFQAMLPSVGVLASSMILPVVVYIMDTPGPENLWSPMFLAGLGALVGWVAGIAALKHPLWNEVKTIIVNYNGLHRLRRAVSFK